MKKKWLAALAAVVLTAGFAACQEKIPSYLKVSGTTVTGYTDGMPANLVIPKGITKIAGGAFADCGWLESVTIPGSVKIIGEDITLEEARKKDMNPEVLSVFYGCRSLKSVTIEKGANTIGICAFYGCESLTSVTIPNSVTKIGEYAFRGCESLASVTIPNSVTEIGEYAFAGCESLASVTIPNSVTEIGAGAFWGCTSLTNVEISSGVTKIGEMTFRDCESLASVTIPNSVTEIGEWAFYGCTSLASVTITKSVSEIGSEAGRDCENIAVVTYKGSLKDWCAVDWDELPLWLAKRIVLSDGTDLKKLTMISANDLMGVTRIGRQTFRGCKSLVSVTIPNSVREIGYEAFRDCTSLASIHYDGTKADWAKIGGSSIIYDLPQGATVRCTDGIITK